MADIGHDPVIIQGPDDRYETWPDVEKRYINTAPYQENEEFVAKKKANSQTKNEAATAKSLDTVTEKLNEQLVLKNEESKTSPISTPPLSPSASDPQSTKMSPEIRCATVTLQEATPVPPTLQPLINFVVWYTYESKSGSQDTSLTFLTNSADAAQIAKDFGVIPKTIHQLRAHIVATVGEVKQQDTPRSKKGSNRSLKLKGDAEPKTLFSYEEDTSEDEEVVFKPRARERTRSGSFSRSNVNGFRSRGALHSPSNSTTSPAIPKPQVPVEEIDPDSFDRGTFARGSTPLVNVGLSGGFANSNSGNGNGNYGRGNTRGGQNQSGQRNGGYRGQGYRNRGRGRLFVP